jgi:hypothetical protein
MRKDEKHLMAYKITEIRNYNTDLKIAGDMITLRTYSGNQIYGYTVKKSISINKAKTDEEIEQAKQMRFKQSARRAKKKIFDLVACNSGKHLDYKGRKQRTKFITITFRENKQDLEEANKEITKYLKRLSYYLYDINKNVIKYIAVPELQQRGAWHYHIILFNMPYIPHHVLFEKWGQGGVYINALKPNSNGVEVAKYVTKYISKGLHQEDSDNDLNQENQDQENQEERKGDKNLSDYQNYKKHNLENKKRYQCSKGLIRPEETRIETTEQERKAILEIMKEYGKGEMYHASYENEHRGEININSMELSKEGKRVLREFVEYIYRKNNMTQGRQIKPKWGLISNIIFNRLWKAGKREDIKLKEIKIKINKELEGTKWKLETR